jgi:ZIP family zinc transporter
MALPMRNGGMRIYKIMIYVILSGLATGVGALVGSIIGKVSEQIIAICLSFAAGAMLYIVSGELIPESNKLYRGRMSALGNMLGFIIGIYVTIL